jgi:hypothetical protein
MANFVLHMTMNQIVETTRQRQKQQQPPERSSSCYTSDYVALDPSRWATTCPWQAAPHDLVRAAIEHLNTKKSVRGTTKAATKHEEEHEISTSQQENGSTTTNTEEGNDGGGVLDVAGGSGLVSMALGMLFGVRSTVVDPR